MALHLRGIDKFIAETEQLNLIQRAVAHCYAVTPALLRFKGPDEKSQLARSVAIYLSRDILLTDLTILEGFFGCEPHESAAAHCNRVAEMIALSRETAATIRNLKSYCVVLVVSDATTLAAKDEGIDFGKLIFDTVKESNKGYHLRFALERLEKLRRDLLDEIDGGEECQGRDTRISEFILDVEYVEKQLKEML